MEQREWCDWYKRRGAGRLRHVLMRQWDPIGVAVFPSARDEYDSYLGLIADRLRRDVSLDDLADTLETIRTKQIGLETNRRADMAAASTLQRWYAVERSRMPTGSVFWRIAVTSPRRKPDLRAAELVEIDVEGYIPREVDITADGTPLRVTRPGEYGTWNDSPIPRTLPDTPEFAAFWHPLGEPMTRAEFEVAYARAVAQIPPKRELGWVPCLAGCALILVLGALVGFVARIWAS